MDVEAELKAQILQILVEDMPQAFFEELGSTARALYSGVFQEISEDPELLESQKKSFLYQKRHFRMESLIAQVSRNNGVPVSEEKIRVNKCAYAYVCPGRVAMTQSYVPETGKLPRPAEFRKLHASMNTFSRMPQLELGDKIVEVSTPKSVNGLIIHSPAGFRFDESSQKLGDLGFYVPRHDYSGWVVNLSLTEIVTAYAPVPKREDKAIPVWKKEQTGSDSSDRKSKK